MSRDLKRRSYLKSGAVSLGGAIGLAGCLGGGGGDGGDGGNGGDDGGDGDDGSDGGNAGGGGGNGDGGDGGGGATTWRFATTNPGTPALSWVNGFAQIIEQNTERLRLEPVTSQAFTSTLVSVRDQEAHLGISDFGVWHAMKNGNDPFDEPVPDDEMPRATIPPLHVSGHWIAGRASKDITSLEDLEGVNYSHWDRGSAGNSITNFILDQAGVELGSQQYEPGGGTSTSVQEGRVDGWTMFIINNFLHTGTFQDMAEQVEHASIEVPEEIRTAVEDEFDGWNMDRIDTGTLNIPVTGDHVDTYFKASNVFARPDADPDLVKLWTETMLNNVQAVGEIHPGLGLFGLGEAPEGAPFDRRHEFTGVSEDVIFHEGAIEYFEENDIGYPGG